MIDWKQIADILGWSLMGLLGFFGTWVWRDLQTMKASWMGRDEFKKEMSESAAARDNRFTRLEDLLSTAVDKRHEDVIAVERRLAEMAVKIAELRPQRPGGEPERRRGY